MANKFEQQIIKLKSQRDDLTIKQVGLIFESIRDKGQLLAASVVASAGDNTEWFQERNRAERFAVKTNKTLRPDYLKKDRFSKDAYINEYNTAYFQSLYEITNTGIAEGFLVKLPKYTEKQFRKAVNDPLSKLMDSRKMKTGRSTDIEQLYTTIVSGVEQGLSLPKINKALDINLGFRDSAGKWIGDVANRKGQTYKTTRILRTEVLRMRSTAETDQWLNQQPIVESNLQLLETLDDRTRPQSAQMDGQISNKEGKFKFPGISEPKFAHRSGKAAFDINDRSSTINVDPEFPPTSRIERDPVTGKNKVVPYKNFEQFAKEKGMTRNKFGQELFPKKKPSVKPKTIAEAESFAKNNIKGLKNVSYRGVNVDNANSINDSLLRMQTKYGELSIDNIKPYTNSNSRVMLSAQRQDLKGRSETTLNVNKRFLRDNLQTVNSKISKANETGYWLSNNLEDLTVHETGHILSYKGKPASIVNMQSSLLESTRKKESWKIKGSRYTNVDGDEAIAEGFLALDKGIPVSQDIKNAVNTYMNQSFK